MGNLGSPSPSECGGRHPVESQGARQLGPEEKVCSVLTEGVQAPAKLSKWENGNESLWYFEVSQADLNKQMCQRKRSLEKQLSEEAAKRRKIKTEVKALRSTTKQQAKVISRLRPCRAESSRGSSSKLWHQYSRQQQHNKKKMLASNVTSVLSFCSVERFRPRSIVRTGKY